MRRQEYFRHFRLATAVVATLCVGQLYANQQEAEQESRDATEASQNERTLQEDSERDRSQERDPNENRGERQALHSGEFTSMKDGQIQITNKDGDRQTVEVNEQTQVMIDGKRASLSELQQGDQIRVTRRDGGEGLVIHTQRRGSSNRERDRRDMDRRQQNGQQQVRGVTLGVRLGPSPTAGVLIQDLHPQGPGARAGLQRGDYILTINGEKIDSVDTYDRQLSEVSPGNRVTLTIWRNSQKQDLPVTFSERSMTFDSGEGQQQDESAWLGIAMRETQDENQQKGVYIQRVYPSGPAARAGLQYGDRLVRINDQEITSVQPIADIIGNKKPNEQIELTVLRDGEEERLTARLGNRGDFLSMNNNEMIDENRLLDRSRTSQNVYGPGQGGYQDYDESYDIPEHVMMMEEHRRACEQRQRLEERLDDVLDQLQALQDKVDRLHGNGVNRQEASDNQQRNPVTQQD